MGIEDFGAPVLPPEPEEEKKPDAQIEKEPMVLDMEGVLVKEEILERLRSEGFNEGIRKEIIKWREFRGSLNMSARDNVLVSVDMLEFYFAAGMAEDAYDDAVQTYYSARATPGCEDLVKIINDMYPELDLQTTPEQILGTQEEQ